jgi:hypothetical protein
MSRQPWGPEMAPHTPQRSERPGEPVALLQCRLESYRHYTGSTACTPARNTFDTGHYPLAARPDPDRRRPAKTASEPNMFWLDPTPYPRWATTSAPRDTRPSTKASGTLRIGHPDPRLLAATRGWHARSCRRTALLEVGQTAHGGSHVEKLELTHHAQTINEAITLDDQGGRVRLLQNVGDVVRAQSRVDGHERGADCASPRTRSRSMPGG